MKKVMQAVYDEVSPKEVEDAVAAKYPNVPLIFGDFTNWQPLPMIEITDFQERFLKQYNPNDILYYL